MMNQKKCYNKIHNNNNNNKNVINTKNIKTTKTKQILLVFYILGSLLILTLSIFSVQTGLAQIINENDTNNVPITNTNKTSGTTTSLTADSKKPMHVPNKLVIVAEDIEEIKDNLQEAREALNNANYLEVLSHINNIDKLLTAFVVPESSTSVDNKNNNTTTNTTNLDSTTLAHLNNSTLIKEYNELIKDLNKKYNEKTVIN